MTTVMCPECGNYHRTETNHVCPSMPGEGGLTLELPRPEQVRGDTHGDYSQMSMVVQSVKEVLHTAPNWLLMTAGQREALDLIATKIGRIVCGDPNHKDHWDDIAGYANLVSARISQAPFRKGQDDVD